MKELYIDNNWNKKKRKLQSNFSELRDEDLRYVRGKEDELVARVGERLGISDYGARKIIRIA